MPLFRLAMQAECEHLLSAILIQILIQISALRDIYFEWNVVAWLLHRYHDAFPALFLLILTGE